MADETRLLQEKENQKISDEVMIELVHAVKDIIIEFINKRYQSIEK
jgi:hypothetical protein|nr:hypothetical protein [uncultured Blautia sp.]